MPVIGKEQERQLTPEEIASQQLEGYIERVEKQPEVSADVAQFVKPSGQVTLPAPIKDDFGQVVMQQAHAEEEAITLPLTQTKIEQGIHEKLGNSIRWLATQCVYLIKKYPGKVFYSRE